GSSHLPATGSGIYGQICPRGESPYLGGCSERATPVLSATVPALLNPPATGHRIRPMGDPRVGRVARFVCLLALASAVRHFTASCTNENKAKVKAAASSVAAGKPKPTQLPATESPTETAAPIPSESEATESPSPRPTRTRTPGQSPTESPSEEPTTEPSPSP